MLALPLPPDSPLLIRIRVSHPYRYLLRLVCYLLSTILSFCQRITKSLTRLLTVQAFGRAYGTGRSQAHSPYLQHRPQLVGGGGGGGGRPAGDVVSGGTSQL